MRANDISATLVAVGLILALLVSGTTASGRSGSHVESDDEGEDADDLAMMQMGINRKDIPIPSERTPDDLDFSARMQLTGKIVKQGHQRVTGGTGITKAAPASASTGITKMTGHGITKAEAEAAAKKKRGLAALASNVAAAARAATSPAKAKEDASIGGGLLAKPSATDPFSMAPMLMGPLMGLTRGQVFSVWVTVMAFIAMAMKLKLNGKNGENSLKPVWIRRTTALEKLSREPSIADMEAVPETPGSPTSPCKHPAEPGAFMPDEEMEPPSIPWARLLHIGASFAVPLNRMSRGRTGRTLSFDIPTVVLEPSANGPTNWPLRAILTRPSEDDAWARIELTVDVIAAVGLPPLMSCDCVLTPEAGSPGDRSPAARCTQGGTGDAGSACSDSDGEDAALSADGGSGGGGVAAASAAGPWLQIRNGGGAVVASISPEKDGSRTLHRQDSPVLEIRRFVSAKEGEPLIAISRRSEPLAQAMQIEQRAGDVCLQVDTRPDTESPESALLLMCMLAVAAFGPLY